MADDAMPGFGNPPTMPAQLASVTKRVLQYSILGANGFTDGQWHDTRNGATNSPAWDIWHVVRTIDNIIHFVFDRETPVWLRDEFHTRWSLPKVDQGTGMSPEEAFALRFPLPAEFNTYTTAVMDAIVPKMENMTDAYLQEFMRIRPWGNVSRAEAILHGLIGHGNGHLGRVSYIRDGLGLRGLGY